MCSRKKENKSGRAGFSRLVWPFLVIALAIGNLLGAAPAAAQTTPLEDSVCPDTGSCAAGDVHTTLISSSIVGSDTCADGSLDIQATLGFDTTAAQRYDLGFFVVTGVDNSGDDVCAGAVPTPELFDDIDDDECGDLLNSSGTVQWTVTMTVPCTRDPDTGNLQVDSCRVWQQNAQTECTTLIDTLGTGSKCDCEPIITTIPLPPDLCADVTCEALDQCHVAGVCDPETGICSNPAKDNGASCNADNSACTPSDTCQEGVCQADTANQVTCTASDQCHVVGTCDPATGICSNPPADDGTECIDGSACTNNDVCTGGTCGGTAVVCTALDQCHVAGTCDPSSGTCSNPPADDGTPCTDTNACTLNDVCESGVCVNEGGPTTELGCKKDTAGADDAVGQKDLTNFCLDEATSCSGTVLTWQWDDRAWSGKNTGDACALYDTDGDGLANKALCVTVSGSPVVVGQTKVRVYTCNDTKQFNCSGATLVTTQTSSCLISNSAEDPFKDVATRRTNKCSGTSCLTLDTEARCCVTTDIPATAALIDVCSYPSQSPSSDPSECVKAVFCTSNSSCSVTTGEGTCNGLCCPVSGVSQCVFGETTCPQ